MNGENDKSSHWAHCVAAEAHQSKTYTVGLMSGSRFTNDRRAIDRLLRTTVNELNRLEYGTSTLLLRLDVFGDLPATSKIGAPLPELKSPLGPWYEIVLRLVGSEQVERTLEQVVANLPQWKQQHRLVVVDLGPMHLAPSRSVGRLCDVCYLLLGPKTCASHDWILQQVGAHDRNGTVIAGSIITTAAA